MRGSGGGVALWAGVALFGASLFLPIGYGAEMGGVLVGWMFLVVPPFLIFSPLYVFPVVGVLVARRWRGVGVFCCGLGLACWTFAVFANKGFVIDAFLSDRKIFASGLLAGLVASVLFTYVAWRRPRAA